MTEKIINRIRKMLDLANDLGATEGERDAALHQAYRTMAHYNLDMTTIKQPEEEVRGGYDYSGFSFPFAKTVCDSIAELFFCNYIVGTKVNGTQCIHHFVGKESNAATAMVMADWIIKSIMKEGRKLYKQNTSPGCRAFCLGAAAKLRQRVDAMVAQATAPNSTEYTGGSALVLANFYDSESKENGALMMTLYNIKMVTPRKSKVNASAYSQGKEFGDKINLSLQVGGKAQAPAGLLK